MVSAENKIIVASLSTALACLLLLGIIDLMFGVPGQWAAVFAFLLLAVFGAILPQLYLLRIDHTVSRTARMGAVTMVVLAFGVFFSGAVSGTESTILWGLVLGSIALIVVIELHDGYRESIQPGTSDV